MKWAILSTKAKVDTARVAELSTGLASAPDRSVVSAAMAAFWANIVGIGLVRRVPIVCVCVNEDLGPEAVALLQVETASVAERLEGRGIPPPKRCGGRLAMRALLDAVRLPQPTTGRKHWALDRCRDSKRVVV